MTITKRELMELVRNPDSADADFLREGVRVLVGGVDGRRGVRRLPNDGVPLAGVEPPCTPVVVGCHARVSSTSRDITPVAAVPR